MISSIYASLLALLIVYLAVGVIKLRHTHRVAFADGGNEELQMARTAHSNAVECIPIALILLFALEFNGAGAWILHLAGITFLSGRMIHARGILAKSFKQRVLGMHFTIWTIVALALLNTLYLGFNWIAQLNGV